MNTYFYFFVMINKVLFFIQRYWITHTIVILAAISMLSLWPDLPIAPGSDKIHHLISYAALAFPTALRRPRLWRSVILFFVTYSGFIELVQPFVNRHGEWLDMLANTTGVGCGIFMAEMARQWIKNKGRE